jgi:hypothetical protein
VGRIRLNTKTGTEPLAGTLSPSPSDQNGLIQFMTTRGTISFQ